MKENTFVFNSWIYVKRVPQCLSLKQVVLTSIKVHFTVRRNFPWAYFNFEQF